MYQQSVTINYLDGTSKSVSLTQWSLGQFAQWASRQGLKVDISDPGLMSVLMMRFQAYAELHRDANGSPVPAFDKWDRTVVEVESAQDSDSSVDPTQLTLSDA